MGGVNDNRRNRGLVLASGSPRRRRLLTEANYEMDVVNPDVDETRLDGEDAESYVRRVSRAKALVAGGGEAMSLGADTVVVLDEAILGKPTTAADAAVMLRSLSGRSHRVLTGWALMRRGELAAAGVGTTNVTFRDLSAGEIAEYIATGEPMDRAGAYAIQGGAGPFVASITGSFTNVVGLPMEAVTDALADLGCHPQDK